MASTQKYTLIGFLMLFFAVLFMPLSAIGQQMGSVTGTVTDATGALVQGAEITARNVGSNITRTVHSNANGNYSIVELPAGAYEITIKKEGFKAFHVAAVQLTVAQALTMNAKLETGAVSEEIQVTENEVPEVDLETAQISNLVDQRKMENLPLITRDPYSLVLLSPGTSQTRNGSDGFSVNGSRDRNNNFLLDGVDNNDTSVPGIPDGLLSANPDSTQEFRVITNNFNAEYGRNTGAIIDVITKSGTNTFHGDAYWYGRYNGFGGARDWFNPESQGPMNPYVRNQFGYSVGGPIIKNKTFFFFNEEFDRFRTTLTNSAVVPTPAFKTGVFTFVDPNGNPVNVDLSPSSPQNLFGLPLDPTMQKVLAAFPNPTVNNGDGFSGTLFYPSSSQLNSYTTTLKIDHHFSDRESLSLRYAYDHSFDPNPFHDDILPGNVGGVSSKAITEGLQANLTSTFSPTVVNTLTFGWNHLYDNFGCTGLNVLNTLSPLDQFGNGWDFNMDPFTSVGCTSLVSNGQFRETGTVSYGDGISLVHGNHLLKFGFDFRNVGESGPDSFNSRRQVIMQNALLGGPTLLDVPGDTIQLEDAAAALYGFVIEDLNAEFFDKNGTRVASDNRKFRQHEYDGYAQDAWKIRSNFTLNFGLRYQFDGVPFEEHANFSNLLTDPSSFPVNFTVVGPGTGHQVYNNDFSNIEPRLGFSWDPWNDGKTAVRGAIGIFHDRVFGNLFGNARGNPPFEQDYFNFPVDTINNTASGAFPITVPNTTPSTNVPDESLIAPIIFDPHFRNSASDNWSLGVQRQVGLNTTVDLAYVGSKGTHIYREVDGNPPDPALVNQLLAICVPGNPLNTTGCSAADVSKSNLFDGAEFGVLPFNAVAHNALFQPFFIRSVGNSNYNSMQLKVTRQMTNGLELQGSYTWAHAIDDSGDPLTPALGNRAFPRNSRDLAEERGNSDNDIRHVGVISYIWELPFGKGKSYLTNGVAGKLLEGIQFSGITSLQSGRPFDVYSTTDSERTGLSNRADLVGDPFGAGTNPNAGAGKVYLSNIAAFAQPAFGGPGNIGRNRLYGPGYVDFDLEFAKRMTFSERFGVELKVECYNLFNHPNFNNPGADGGALGNQLGSPLFGVITSTVSQPDSTTSARQMQVALKLSF